MPRRLLMLIVACVAAGCVSTPSQEPCRPLANRSASCWCTGGACTGCCPDSGCSAAPEPGLPVAGEEMTLPIVLPLDCTGSAIRATVGVTGPDNASVPLSEGDRVRPVTDGHPTVGMWTLVTVKATSPGNYRLAARFEPNIGLVQTDVLVAEDHRGDAPAFSIDTDGGGLARCRHVDVSPHGWLLCLERANAGVFDSSGARVQELSRSAGPVARAGPVLWTTSPTRRWVETDAGFTASPDGGVEQPFARAIVPAENDLLVVDSYATIHQAFVDGGGLSTARDVLDFPGLAPTAAWRSGPEVIVIVGDRLCAGVVADAGGCLAPRAPTIGAAGVDPSGGVWVATQVIGTHPRSAALGLLPGTAGVTIPSSWDVVADGGEAAWDTGVWVQSDTGGQRMFVGARDGQPVLQKFRDDLELISVTSSWVTFREPGGRVLVYRR